MRLRSRRNVNRVLDILKSQSKKNNNKNTFLEILIVPYLPLCLLCSAWSRYQQQASWESLCDQFSVAADEDLSQLKLSGIANTA